MKWSLLLENTSKKRLGLATPPNVFFEFCWENIWLAKYFPISLSYYQHKSQIEKLLLMLALQPQLHKTDVTCHFFSVGSSKIEL
jgi:hypothetical protein